jgi:spore maturation protein SpmB
LETFVGLILDSGKSAINLALYILLPIMVIMMAIMHTLEQKGWLKRIAVMFSPVLGIFGIPGVGAFAVLQILLISFAAPIATFKIMNDDEGYSQREIATTFAATIVMSQANAAFPLIAVGLNITVTIISSLIGGIIAAFIVGLFIKKEENSHNPDNAAPSSKRLLPLLFEGGEKGILVVYKSLPALVISIFFVNVLKKLNILNIIENIVSPIFQLIGISSISVVPIMTKFLAGGTAMMAVAIDMIEKGLMTEKDLNMLAGFIINPIDPVGMMVFLSVGVRFQKVLKPVLIASIVGLIARGIIHLVYFY